VDPRKDQWPRHFNIIAGFLMYPKYTSNLRICRAMDFCSEHEAPLNDTGVKFIWRLTANGKYSSTSTYKALFMARSRWIMQEPSGKLGDIKREDLLLAGH
jgi:hypothetical protein